MNSKFLLILLFIKLPLVLSLAQSKKEIENKKEDEKQARLERKERSKIKYQPDTNFIVNYSNMVTVGAFAASPIMQLTITPTDKRYEEFKSDYRGNFSDLVGVLFSYKKLSFRLGFKTPFNIRKKDTDPDKIVTRSTGISIQIRKPVWVISAEYKRYAGYYDNNSPNYIPPPDTIAVRPDIRYHNIGLSGIYNFSWKKYSFNAPETFNDRQLKTRFGFLAKAGIHYISISSTDSTLLSSVQAAGFESFDYITAVNSILLKAGPGLGVNIVFFKRIYVGINYFFMGNFINYTYEIQDKETSDWRRNFNFYTESNLGFGYNSKRIFAGVSISGDINVMRIRDASVRTRFGTLFITAGYRFDAPRSLKKIYRKTPILNK